MKWQSRAAALGLLSLVMLMASIGLRGPADAQQARKPRLIGFLSISPRDQVAHLLRALDEGLRELGYAQPRDVTFESRFADGKPERLPGLVGELVRFNVDLMVAYGATSARAAKNATATIPIVMLVHPDPVSAGLVASLAHPGGNVTGLARLSQELSAKRLALLKETVPAISRTAVLWYAASPDAQRSAQETETAAHGLGVNIRAFPIRDSGALDSAFVGMIEWRADSLVVVPSSVLWDHRSAIVRLAEKHRLAAIYPEHEFVEAGGLMAYGASLPDQFRRAATYVDKILKGAKPADIPIEQPTKLDLVINLKTARALGLMIPPSLLLRADHVIE
jgi:putative tryptophan/tyrosine transport system substrate-binding protein